MEVKEQDYEYWKEWLIKNNISIAKEVIWKSRARSMYFRDPIGNLIEFITPGEWPV
jgi:hypothetical protein